MRAFVWTCRGEWPKTSMWPLVGYNNPSNSFTVVDLPEPFGPSRPNTSPRRTSKSTLSTARALGRFQKSLKILVRPRTETTTSSLPAVVFCAGCAKGSKTLEGIINSFAQRLCEIRRLDQAYSVETYHKAEVPQAATASLRSSTFDLRSFPSCHFRLQFPPRLRARRGEARWFGR